MRPIHSEPETVPAQTDSPGAATDAATRTMNHVSEHDYLFRFFGYGDPTSPLWFVGIEEGGPPGKSPAAAAHDSILLGTEHCYFDPKTPMPEDGRVPPLWRKYRRISELAGNAGNFFMSNMAPLARPGINDVLPGVTWPEYQRRVSEERIPTLRRLIGYFRPRAVLFQGVTGWRGYRVRETFGVPVREGRIQVCPEQRLVFTNFLLRGFPNTDRNDVVALLQAWLGTDRQEGHP